MTRPAAALTVLAACAQVQTAATGEAAPRIVTFPELSSWTYVDGTKGMPGTVQDLSGRRVAITGTLIHFERREALLTAAPGGEGPCRGPDIHGIVRVVFASGLAAEHDAPRVRVTGRFHVEATVRDGHCVDIYQLYAERVERID